MFDLGACTLRPYKYLTVLRVQNVEAIIESPLQGRKHCAPTNKP
ncbi:hypothetical protein Oscil6304_4427 [Oscillatoria acuminata PCC 6304]|uniref:Uncharacterized protein n=1 Tax=Oscillatoria acuminata PCC 6304 TaxID=56110 RepID=K9TM70_9CYAN|nr:hypothetical protein Oscil6304_4427 [Oscillatoria acuminata PCC 6304]